METPRISGPMRDLFRALPVFIGMALLITILAMLPGRANQMSASAQTPAETQTYPRTVSVSGTGAVEATPDIAVVVLGVQTDSATARDALTSNNDQMGALITALRAAGIAQGDIKTLSVQLYPRYNDFVPTPIPTEKPIEPTPTANSASGGGSSGGSGDAASAPDAAEVSAANAAQDSQNRISGYTATNTVEVTIRDLNRLGQTIDDAVTAGGNTIQGIRFDIAEPNALYDQARQAAMTDARRKAEQLADLAGAELGVVITISEFSRTPVMYESAAMDMRAGSSVPVSPGSQKVTIDVQVVWELR